MSVGRVLLAAIVGGIGWSGAPAISLSTLADSLNTLAELAPWHANPSASRYELGPVEPAEMIKTVTATGTVEATINVEVGSQLSGQVATLLADFNDVVHKGQVLAQLDESTYRAQAEAARGALEGAEADVRVAEAKLARAKIDLEQVDVQRSVLAARAEVARIAGEMALRQANRKAALGLKGVAAQSEVEDSSSRSDEALAAKREAEANLAAQNGAAKAAQADVARASAELDSARAAVHRLMAQLGSAMIDLERTRIRSPIDGVVVGRNVERGQTLASTLETHTLFVVAGDLRRMEIHARVDESDIAQIAVGQPVEFTVDAFPGRQFEATVRQIRKEPQIIQNVVTYIVVLTAANDDYALLPGMTVVAKIETARAIASLTVPLAALRFRPRTEAGSTPPGSSASVVWTLRDNVPTPISVAVGSQDDERAAITAGDLRAGDQVLTGEAFPGAVAPASRQGQG